MIDLVEDFETRIRILSRSLRSEVDPKDLIRKVKNHYEKLKVIELSDRTNIDSLAFDKDNEDFVVQGRKAPSRWIGEYLAELFPKKRVQLSWLSINWKRGCVIYCFDNGKLQVDIK
jgi:hypothetical protein